MLHTFTLILTAILMLISVALIIAVLMQPGKSAGLSGAISGGAETFFGKNKAKSYEGKLVLLTKIMTGVMFVLSLGLVIMVKLGG